MVFYFTILVLVLLFGPLSFALGRLVVPVVDAFGLRRGHGGHDDGVPRPQGPVLAGLVALLPRLDAVSHDPRSVLKSEILLLT